MGGSMIDQISLVRAESLVFIDSREVETNNFGRGVLSDDGTVAVMASGLRWAWRTHG